MFCWCYDSLLKSKTKIKHKLKKVDVLKISNNTFNKVVVGLPSNSNAYSDGASVILVGAIHEFGSPEKKIPERSFLRVSILDNKYKYKKFLVKQAKLIVREKTTMSKALNLLGATAVGNIQERIRSNIAPKLKYREGTALWDTGHLIESITWEVR